VTGDGLSLVAVDAPIAVAASLFVDADDRVRDTFTAEWVADALTDVVDRRGSAVLGLVGGTSVASVHERLREVDFDWSRVTITLADERAVPATSDERNWRVVEPLVDPLVAAGRLPTDNLVPLGDLPADATPDDVEGALAPLRERIEQVDVALLGLGPDGHVASLFPGHPGLSAVGSFVVVEDAPKPPPLRMSATVGMLAGADAIALVGHGDAKAEAVAAVAAEGPLSQRPGRIVHLARRGVLVTDRLPR
jgi:6-phosphogluconolactonase